MARVFSAAGTNKLSVASAAVTVHPISMACWFKPNSVNTTAALINVSDGGTTNRWGMTSGSGGSTGALTCRSGGNSAATSANFTNAVWSHGCAVFASTTSRAIYLNGGSKGSSAVSATVTGVNLTEIGSNPTGAANYWNGDLAEVAIWNITLTDAEVALLGSTTTPISPLLMHPEALLFYAPLLSGQSPEVELMGARSLTVTGATVSTHPPIHYPARRNRRRFNATAVASDTVFAQAIM